MSECVRARRVPVLCYVSRSRFSIRVHPVQPRGQGGAPGVVQLNRVHSSATAVIGGSMYFPDQQIEVGSGNNPSTSLTINGGIVAADINFAADSYVHVLGFAGGTPYGVKKASLVK